jgi:fatty acid-binding protein DegV
MSLCILTNDSALFPFISPGNLHFLRSMPLNVNSQGMEPGVDDFKRVYNQLEHEFSALLVLSPSPALLGGFEAAQLAAQCHGGTLKISVLNTTQIGPGLGILAQQAAHRAACGDSLPEVEDAVRAITPHLFTLICPGKNPQDRTAPVSDQPNQPIFSLEEGALVPYKKVRTRRHLIEDLQEFMEEFETPQQITYFHGNASKQRPNALREAAGRLFPNIHLNDLNINPPLAALFGPETMGMTILEIPAKMAS